MCANVFVPQSQPRVGFSTCVNRTKNVHSPVDEHRISAQRSNNKQRQSSSIPKQHSTPLPNLIYLLHVTIEMLAITVFLFIFRRFPSLQYIRAWYVHVQSAHIQSQGEKDKKIKSERERRVRQSKRVRECSLLGKNHFPLILSQNIVFDVCFDDCWHCLARFGYALIVLSFCVTQHLHLQLYCRYINTQTIHCSSGLATAFYCCY